MTWRVAGGLLAAALVLLVLVVLLPSDDQVAVRPPAGVAPDACITLLNSVPQEVDGRDRRETRPPSEFTAAWGDPAVVLRCAVERPAALTQTSEVVEVEGVGWLVEERPRAYVFTTVGRAPYLEVRVPVAVPRERATAPLVDLARAIEDTVPDRP